MTEVLNRQRDHSAVHIANRHMNFDRPAMLEDVLCVLDDLIGQRLVESLILQLRSRRRLDCTRTKKTALFGRPFDSADRSQIRPFTGLIPA